MCTGVSDFLQKLLVVGHHHLAGLVDVAAAEGDLVITLGCGDIYKASKMMVADNQ